LDWVQKYLVQMRVALLFNVGQKYARVGSGPISTESIKKRSSSGSLKSSLSRFHQKRFVFHFSENSTRQSFNWISNNKLTLICLNGCFIAKNQFSFLMQLNQSRFCVEAQH